MRSASSSVPRPSPPPRPAGPASACCSRSSSRSRSARSPRRCCRPSASCSWPGSSPPCRTAPTSASRRSSPRASWAPASAPAASPSCCPASRSRTSIGVPAITWLGQAAGWRIAYLAVAGIFALTFVAVLLAVPWQPGDPHATMKRELRAFSRSQVWFALGIGAIGFGGLFAVYSYVAPLATEVTGLPAVDGARRAHRLRPRHDDRQPRRRTARRLERPPQHVRVLRHPGRRAGAARLHRRQPGRALHRRVPGRRLVGRPVAHDPGAPHGRRPRQPVDRGGPEPLGAEHRQQHRSSARRDRDRRRPRLRGARSGSAWCSRSRACCWPSRRSRSTGRAVGAASWCPTPPARSRSSSNGRGRRASSRRVGESSPSVVGPAGAAPRHPLSRTGAGSRRGSPACAGRPWCPRRSRRRGTSRGCA